MNKIFKIGGAVLGVIAIAVVAYFLVTDMKNKQEISEAEFAADSLSYEINDTISSEISDVDSTIFENVTNEVIYHVIVGSFIDVENAKKLQYIYDDAIILPMTDMGFHRVSAIRFDNYEDCFNKVKSFRNNYGPKSAWLLKD